MKNTFIMTLKRSLLQRSLLVCTLLASTLFLTHAPEVQAQCSAPNSAFKSGETLIYDLYFNWKFVWVKVGTASMNTTQTIYHGKPAWRSYLITQK